MICFADKARIIGRPTPAIRRLTQGYNTSFQCNATGLPKPTIEWRDSQNKKVDPYYDNRFSLQDGTWTITGILAKDAGRYSCTAENKAGDDVVFAEISAVDGTVYVMYI